jgi:hypothetical protein
LFFAVMPALVAGIHVFGCPRRKEDVDGRDKPGHDVGMWFDMGGTCWWVRHAGFFELVAPIR